GPPCCAVPEREFAQPVYGGRYDGPRTDFRETIAWRSRLRTDAAGKGEIAFFMSDAVTSFKVVAEGAGGGRLGRGEALVQSKKPVSLAVKLPLEVSAGDHVRLPVTIANETDQPYRATLAAEFGKAFAVTGGALAPALQLAPGERRSTFYELDVTGDGRDPGDGRIAIAVDAANLRDTVERTVRVVAPGFPQQASLAGTLTRTARHEVTITDVLPGTLRGTLTMYPSPLATMVQGTEAMIAEPGGCFEQASSTNYPNIMILSYLEENGAAAPAIVERAHTALDHGYKLLTGYETPSKGYEWFGSNPGHEALTAYGLMEFRDMAKVYGDVDRAMIDRTRDWLRGRRDGKGGFQRNPQQLDSFGGASPEVTDAYIAYALSEAGERDLTAELDKQRRSAAATRDPYLLALATKVLIAQAPADDATRAAVGRLAAMQAADGAFPGADHSITRSGGDALTIETTSLAALALMAAGAHAPQVRSAIEWLDKHRNGSGGYGSTQSTVLALKAMAAYAKDSRRTQASGTVTLVVNGAEVGKLSYEKGHQGALELPIARHLRPGKNTIEVALDSTEPLPYSALIEWGSKVPASDPAAAVRIATRLARSTVKLGETAHVDVEVRNATDRGIPMTLARVGLPGGLTFQTWQLQELRDKHVIDFYETRPREVIVYFRSLGPGAVREIPLELMATVPGTFTSPASRAYLYYTNERKHWVAPSTVTIAP
ncbi:MAG TPA: alpha-2-macroglobulin family protein, partial [Kofleriaceae bacterium]